MSYSKKDKIYIFEPRAKKEVLDILKEYVVTSDDFDEIYENWGNFDFYRYR